MTGCAKGPQHCGVQAVPGKSFAQHPVHPSTPRHTSTSVAKATPILQFVMACLAKASQQTRIESLMSDSQPLQASPHASHQVAAWHETPVKGSTSASALASDTAGEETLQCSVLTKLWVAPGRRKAPKPPGPLLYDPLSTLRCHVKQEQAKAKVFSPHYAQNHCAEHQQGTFT